MSKTWYLEHDLRVPFFDGTECAFLIEQYALTIAPPCSPFFLESALGILIKKSFIILRDGRAQKKTNKY